MVNFDPNVVGFLITVGAIQWYVVGSYVLPNDVPAVHHVEQALEAASKGLQIILMRDLNVQLKTPRDEREEDMATALADRGLVSMKYHFMP